MTKGVRTTIVVLSICLALSVIALAGILIYKNYFALNPTTVVVPDNLISPDAEEKKDEATSGDHSAQGTGAENTGSAVGTTVPAAALYLYEKHEGDNIPFDVQNMFPGDSITQNYCVRVDHKGTVTVRYHADIRPGFEKLAEVLKCRIVLLTTGETLYDGLMRDMPEALMHELPTDSKTTSELYYAITAYLDTSVGNDYQNKKLIADFRWWVEETEQLLPPPTGSDSLPIYLAVGACLLAGALILVCRKRKAEEG